MTDATKEPITIETTEKYEADDTEQIKKRFVIDCAAYLNLEIKDKVSGIVIILFNRGENFSQKVCSFGNIHKNYPMLDWLKNIGILDMKHKMYVATSKFL